MHAASWGLLHVAQLLTVRGGGGEPRRVPRTEINPKAEAWAGYSDFHIIVLLIPPLTTYSISRRLDTAPHPLETMMIKGTTRAAQVQSPPTHIRTTLDPQSNLQASSRW